MDDKEPFLSRWSRRKLEAKEDAPAAVAATDETRSVTAAPPLAPAIQPPATELPQPDTHEYREFFDPQVDEKLRRTALKKLFGDPHFNVMDGLDTYIDDYSKPDPIPEAMLRQLNQAQDLFLFDDEEKAASGRAGDQVPATAGEAAPVAALETTTPPQAPPANAADAPDAAATTAAAAAK